jgi:uncharacterized SAM-binding protein YcdF (DUF218 family)
MKKLLIAAPLACVVIFVLGFMLIANEVRLQAGREESRPADAIVILGAAEYRGKPSPVLKARLDHGIDLYRRNLAPKIITTGGAGGDPRFTESEVGRNYLIANEVPPEAILMEDEGESTIHSASAVAEILQRMNLRSCIVVSDGYHVFRVKQILSSRGFEVYGSPRPAAPMTTTEAWKKYFRQAAAYLLWRVGVNI